VRATCQVERFFSGKAAVYVCGYPTEKVRKKKHCLKQGTVMVKPQFFFYIFVSAFFHSQKLYIFFLREKLAK
jgi:hypothetical protein